MQKLTSVQASVLRRLAREPEMRATVGVGLPFRCNRITARSLIELGLITGTVRFDREPYTITLVAAGAEWVRDHP